jgi:hypothetical protein
MADTASTPSSNTDATRCGANNNVCATRDSTVKCKVVMTTTETVIN